MLYVYICKYIQYINQYIGIFQPKNWLWIKKYCINWNLMYSLVFFLKVKKQLKDSVTDLLDVRKSGGLSTRADGCF